LLLPYLLAGSAFSMFEQAYLKASSLYPLATMNATNLWYLLDLNFRPDTIPLLSPDNTASGLGLALTPKWLGLGSCALWCLYLLIDSLKHNDKERLWRNAILCATGFFVLLPGMHERYLVPAVVIALVAAVFGFGGIAAGAVGIAKILFFVFVVMAVVTFVVGLLKRG
jgi:uncharacterized membrane protein YtjA (UPF0391 family)